MIAMRPLFALEAIVAPPIDVGMTLTGQRRIVLFTGGHFSGRPHPRKTVAWNQLPARRTPSESIMVTLVPGKKSAM
jgi:hypothetical protein